MKAVSRRRFDALAGYVRYPWSFVAARELEWYASSNDILLGLISEDTVDNDYVATVLARDAKLRFRGFDLQINLASLEEARETLRIRLSELTDNPPDFFHQGDEKGGPVDFFTPLVADNQRSKDFERIRTAKHFAPGLGLMRELMHHFVDPDGNFIQQFQSTGFDPRFWEIYLYALFTELGYGLDRSKSAPDFHCIGPLAEFFVEATTVNPSSTPPVVTEENRDQYFDDYVPIKFGSALLSKLSKKYWELTHVAEKPLLIAIQDFHEPGAMVWSNTGLVDYLYGVRQRETRNANGRPVTTTEPVDFHRWGQKQIPSGFFRQPDSQHISAVLANPGGTLSKLNRMGFLSGFGDGTLAMIRRGYAYQGGISPTPFRVRVDDGNYDETWCEGLSIYHNPNAQFPLPEVAFPGAAHHTAREGKIVSMIPPFFPLGSQTIILAGKTDEPPVELDEDSGPTRKPTTE